MIKENEIDKRLLANFGRSFTILLNRCFMYSANHPFLVDAISSTHQVLDQALQGISPTVFILNGEQFYVDEEPLDPRLSVSKIVPHFKKTGMESISFYSGVEKKELQLFLEIATSLERYQNVEEMKKAMFKKQVTHIKINHFFYKKVSAEDEVISRNILDKVTPEMMGDDHEKIRRMFMDSVFNSVLQEEFIKSINLENMLENPDGLSKKMIDADLTTVKKYENKNQGEEKNQELRPGQFLLHQLELLDDDVERNLSEGKGSDLPRIADAIFNMRQKLIEGIEAQKALGIAYANEAEVCSKATEITDKVLIQLIREEYRGGETGVSRMAQILCRLIPEADELKRLLPKIKTALLEEGMSQADFMILIQELGRELESDSLANILSESAEEIGVDGKDLIQQVKENPAQSAEMIYLASEIRKSGGDEKALTDVLVNYVEQVGARYSQGLQDKKGEEGEMQIQQAMTEVKSSLVQHLGSLNIDSNLFSRLEDRVNRRMDEVFNKLRSEWIQSHSISPEQGSLIGLTVLQTFERGVSEEEELGQVLKIIRKKAEAGEIDENDFVQIYTEITRQEQLRKSATEQKSGPSGIVREQMLMTYLDKEIARAKRFKTSLSVIGFTLVKAKAKNAAESKQIKTQDIMNTLLQKLVEIFRSPDIIGEVRKNHFIVMLPMTHYGQANIALRRTMKILHLNPLDVGGLAIEIKVAGVAVDVNLLEIANSRALIDHLT
ncbi:MAG: hypothetical protein JXL81_02745, partial [Deltaproteobacteria bacterium]|nr:hypothetical protein [Deltaproteobacteria bacterium]